MNRLFLFLLLGLLLGACALLHPYRLPTPPVSPELKAQRKAAARARKQSAHDAAKKSKQKADDAPAAPDAAPAGAAPADAADATPAKEPSRAGKVKYDNKSGLMKKPRLLRRRVHKRPKKPFKPFEAIGNLFHRKPNFHGKDQPRAPRPDAAPAP